MRTQTEADKTFLELVQGSLQASAKEAERLAKLTGTRLVRIDSAQPAVPKELLPILEEWKAASTVILSKAKNPCLSASGLSLLNPEEKGMDPSLRSG